MNYLTASEIAKKWCVSERSVRNYCAQGRVEGAVLNGKTWPIPKDAENIVVNGQSETQNHLVFNITKGEKREFVISFDFTPHFVKYAYKSPIIVIILRAKKQINSITFCFHNKQLLFFL